MSARLFVEGIEPCPWLPPVERRLDASVTRRLGADRGPRFYLAALRYAQSQWRAGQPAQAILQLNKAWLADLAGDEPVLADWPPPYRALAWILAHAPPGSFLGNPVRHFQHLATRMNGVRREARSLRAWACFHLAERVLPGGEFPRDEHQVARESIIVPGISEVADGLRTCGWPGEAEGFIAALDGIGSGNPGGGGCREGS